VENPTDPTCKKRRFRKSFIPRCLRHYQWCCSIVITAVPIVVL